MSDKPSKQPDSEEAAKIAEDEFGPSETAAAPDFSENTYRMIVENTLDGICIIQNRHICFSNPALSRIMGYSAEELTSRPFTDFAHEGYRQVVLLRHNSRLQGNLGDNNYPAQFTDSQGRAIWLVIQASPVIWQGAPAVMCFVRDITEQKKVEEELKYGAHLLGLIVDNIPTPVFVIDRQHKVTHWNKACQALTGANQDDVIRTQRHAEIFYGHKRSLLADLIVDGAENADIGDLYGPNYEYSKLINGAIGSEGFFPNLGENGVWLTFLAAPLRDDDGVIVGAIETLFDTTESKSAEAEKHALEQQLRHSQKMESLGTLAGGIAHDFNNILGAVMGYSELALDRLEQRGDNREEIDHVLHAAERAKKLVRQILTFGRKMTSERNPLDFNHEITRGIELLRNLIPKMINLDVKLSERPIVIQGDSTQLEQVMVNLGVNAADAMPEGGSLSIETRLLEADEAYCSGRPDLEPGTYALMIVRDTGSGMDEEVQSLIFDPFFTTKEVGKGTGLGLSTVYGIVKGHQGRISCHSKRGLGTEFHVYFPAVDMPVSQAGQTEALPPPEELTSRGRETVLIVDDEPALRNVSRGAMEREGYRVFTAASGEEALALYEDVGQEIDLVVLDVGMPGMGGVQCLDGLREMNPDVLVLVVSGYSREGPLLTMLERNPAGYLAKPFKVDQLLAETRRLLDQPAQVQ